MNVLEIFIQHTRMHTHAQAHHTCTHTLLFKRVTHFVKTRNF